MTRDPRTDPQPGDELRGGAIMRRMLKREGGKLLIQSEHRRYWMRVDRWREWCEKSGAEGAAVANQEG
jgi:hypothetical protein